jgi:hypothetical protein
MRKIKTILTAFFKLFFKKEPGFKKQRMDICEKCTSRNGFVCGVCFCYLDAKTTEESERCPLGKWESQKAG